MVMEMSMQPPGWAQVLGPGERCCYNSI